MKNTHVAGGNVVTGTINLKDQFKLLRKGEEVGRGHIGTLQMAKSPVSIVESGNEFGMMLECKVEPEQNDVIETFKLETK
jgi:translation initiation factor IF-2